MKRVKVWAMTNIVGSKCEDEVEVEDDATPQEIEQIARETAFNMMDWGFSVDGQD